MMGMRASLCVAAVGVALIVGRAEALSGTATIALTSSTGGNNTFTINLRNTSATDPIGTFWFAWTPPGDPVEYDFLPTMPSAAAGPTGWVAPISPGSPGTSIEYYDLDGTHGIMPGQTGTFTFTTTDSQAALQGKQFGFFPITESFIYAGQPEVGAFAQVNPVFVAAPEPASVGVLGVLVAGLLVRRRGR